jgi:hypothetical protein
LFAVAESTNGVRTVVTAAAGELLDLAATGDLVGRTI